MQCIKTGFSIYITSLDKYSRMDLFFDGQDLYCNYNDLYDSVDYVGTVEIVCDSIQGYDDKSDNVYGMRYLIVNPTVSDSVIKYVDTMAYKGTYESLFLNKFKNV